MCGTTSCSCRPRSSSARSSEGPKKVKAEGAPLQVALYIDRARDRHVIGLVKNTGVGDMCNVVRFQTWSDERRGFVEVDVLPEDEIDSRVAELRGNDHPWWPELPVRGTDTDVVDEEHRRILTLRWSDGGFVVGP